MDTLVTLSSVLAIASVAESVHWIVFAYRAVREWRNTPFLRPIPPSTSESLPSLTVVIPAHNEERVAAACARSVLACQYPNLELIMVLDRCTDGTRAALQPIAFADHRLRIIENESCPDDWAGKCNAARVGAEHARGDLLLFADADTSFHPQLLRSSVLMMRNRGLAMLSLFSAPTHNHWFEMLVQPVTSLMLLKIFPILRANATERKRPFANGQFMLFLRDAYRTVGGHAAVKDDLLEDLAFARRMKKLHLPQGVAVSGGMLVVSMYDSWNGFRTGWKRIYIESCTRSPERMRTQAFQLLGIAVVMPLLRTLSLLLAAVALLDGHEMDTGTYAFAMGALIAGVAAPILRALTLGWIYYIASFPVWSVLFFSAAAGSVAGIFLEGASDLIKRIPVRWGGREYILTPATQKTKT